MHLPAACEEGSNGRHCWRPGDRLILLLASLGGLHHHDTGCGHPNAGRGRRPITPPCVNRTQKWESSSLLQPLYSMLNTLVRLWAEPCISMHQHTLKVTNGLALRRPSLMLQSRPISCSLPSIHGKQLKRHTCYMVANHHEGRHVTGVIGGNPPMLAGLFRYTRMSSSSSYTHNAEV